MALDVNLFPASVISTETVYIYIYTHTIDGSHYNLYNLLGFFFISYQRYVAEYIFAKMYEEIRFLKVKNFVFSQFLVFFFVLYCKK